jgi:phosphoglycolate phosphatase-like HAD superfamily hydrolase
MRTGIVKVQQDGTLVLSEELMESFADVRAFWATQEDGFILLMPLDREGEEAQTAAQALAALRQMAAKAEETTRTPEEVLEELRAIRRQIWAEEYRPQYTTVLERHHAANTDGRPR